IIGDKRSSNTNKLYEIYKNNLAWENKMIESRELVAQQLKGVSKIIDSLSGELDFNLKFKENISSAVKKELEEIGEENVCVTASENKEEKTELLIKHRCCGCERVCTSRIIPAVNKVLGKTMARANCDCVISKNNICTLRLCEAKKFHITSAVARSSKNIGKISGDSYSFMPIDDGKYMLLLSDGMGSGMKAHEESAATIELFEDFMSAGFDRKIAIDIINSVLVMRSAGDNFSTMDICTINLYTGAAEFVKIGAAAAFILRDGNVDVIGSSSLPIGILNNVEAETKKRRLKDGDMIVMVTDGITDAFSGKEEKSSEIKSILRKYHGTNPSELADYIMERAKDAGGISDDMTVLTARIWKSV
ncbi:MAG: SpoIIE family protein phosphatase, partial [Firmicutes bacterium]|nr:SpoIIE family protein phosphatase [Bacillota bacterium]